MASREFEDWVKARAEELGAARFFYKSIAGVTMPNADGGDRQAILALCEPRDPLELVPEPDNAFHADAVKVMGGERTAAAGMQLGYLDRRCAEDVNRRLEAGMRVEANFCERRECHHDGERMHHAAVIVIFEMERQAAMSAK